jgi:single-strand DNA-binding protein
MRTVSTGSNVATFGVATNYTWKDQAGQKQEKVEFHNIVAWSRLAEICGQYLRKGSKVYIEGRIQSREWDGQDGIKRKTTEIIAENMIMLDRAGGAPQGGGYTPYNRPQQSATAQMPEPTIDYGAPSNQPNPQEDEIKVEDIPF